MKVLVSADTIKTLHRDGNTTLAVCARDTIITPEARDLAGKLGVAITDSAAPPAAADSATVSTIRQALEAQLPAGKHDPALLEQLVRKALQELPAAATDSAGAACQRQVSASGVVLVNGNSVQFGQFDGAPDRAIGISDVIGAADNSSVGAGFMQWRQASFEWTLTYDEIDVVLEGELHIRCDGNTYVGRAGDVFFIPKGTTIEFATPSEVRFVYVTYPADWSAAQDSA